MKCLIILFLLLNSINAENLLPSLNSEGNFGRTEGTALKRFLQYDSLSEDYILGAGDILDVEINDLIASYQLGPMGNFIIEGFGEVNLNGLTVQEARLKILTLAKSKVGNPLNFNVILVQSKLVMVAVNGAVVNPSVMNIGRGERISNLLTKAGWFTVRANPQKIILKKSNGKAFEIDYTKILRDSNFTENYTLDNGDVLYVPYISALDPTVVLVDTISNIAVPFIPNRSVFDYYNLSSLYNEGRMARYSSFTVLAEDGRMETFPIEKAKDISVPQRTSIYFDVKLPTVMVGGAVDRKGRFDFRPTWRVIDYLALAGTGVITQSLESVRVVSSNGESKYVNAYNYYPQQDDFIEVDRSFFEYFKEWVGIVGGLASTVAVILAIQQQLEQ